MGGTEEGRKESWENGSTCELFENLGSNPQLPQKKPCMTVAPGHGEAETGGFLGTRWLS